MSELILSGVLAVGSLLVIIGILVRHLVLSQKKNKELVQRCVGLQDEKLSQQERIEQLEKDCKRATDMFHLHLEKNQEFEKQRNRVWDIYRLAGLQAGTAQGMLMRELQLALRKLNVYKKKLGEEPEAVSRELQEVVDNFAEQHGDRRPEELQLSE